MNRRTSDPIASARAAILDRAQRRHVEKFADRRTELADPALQTLAELGYSHMSLGEIANDSDSSHGVPHSYFSDTVDLITCPVRHYEARYVTRYDRVIAEATRSPIAAER